MGNQPINGEKGKSSDNNQNSFIFDKNELKMLYKNFVKLDRDHSGQIEPHEFFDVPELKENPIVQRIITVFDKNNDGKISFYEFVNGLSILTNSGKKMFKQLRFLFFLILKLRNYNINVNFIQNNFIP